MQVSDESLGVLANIAAFRAKLGPELAERSIALFDDETFSGLSVHNECDELSAAIYSVVLRKPCRFIWLSSTNPFIWFAALCASLLWGARIALPVGLRSSNEPNMAYTVLSRFFKADWPELLHEQVDALSCTEPSSYEDLLLYVERSRDADAIAGQGAVWLLPPLTELQKHILRQVAILGGPPGYSKAPDARGLNPLTILYVCDCDAGNQGVSTQIPKQLSQMFSCVILLGITESASATPFHQVLSSPLSLIPIDRLSLGDNVVSASLKPDIVIADGGSASALAAGLAVKVGCGSRLVVVAREESSAITEPIAGVTNLLKALSCGEFGEAVDVTLSLTSSINDSDNESANDYASMTQYLWVKLYAAMAKLTHSVGSTSASVSRSPNNTDPGTHTVVLFWKQNDTGLYGRRSDMVAKALAQHPSVKQVLIVDAPITKSRLLNKAQGHSLTHDRLVYAAAYQKALGFSRTEKLLTDVFIYEAESEHDLPLESEYLSYLRELFAREGVTPASSVFWYYPKAVHGAAVVRAFEPAKVVVDVVDDHRAWPGVTEEQSNEFTRHYREMLSLADVRMANCQSVQESMQALGFSVDLVPNGCESSPDVVVPEGSEVYDELASFQGPIIGFVGNLETKIDIPLLYEIAKTFPDSLIALVGSTHANPAVRELLALPNVRLTGVLEYRFTPALVRLFSVAIVPHLNTPLTKSMNPLKAYVYLAGKIPVVATNVPNLPQTPWLKVANDHVDFINHIHHVLAEGTRALNGEALAQFIHDNSWEQRLAPVIKKLGI
ncbi:glycosyltransferase family protein [Gilvimarinus agarilyticus]|uniref:glycosyltransferase n=1 Tax=Gilvimarinus agarilyticus TaxID=679259 RepID=UPI0005A25E54|nr:glycosyltransferase [Gilvimarinus agarilyticus]